MERFFAAIQGGGSISAALRVAERSPRTYYKSWLNDPWFTERFDKAKFQATTIASPTKLPFIEFRYKVLGRVTFPHMKQWAEWFESSESDHILILCPPESAKTTFVIDYILWRIYLDPQIRVGYVSKSLPHSQKQVSKIKNTIEQNKTLQMLCDNNLVPGPGDPHPWTNSYFTVRSREWSAGSDEADYTVNSFGSGSQITGSRFDLLIFDDPDDTNVGRADREKIWNVILQAGETRLGVSGRMIVIGNRQDEEDVYRLILDQWTEEPDLWAVYIQKAIQEVNDLQKPVTVIWPEKFGLPRVGGWERKPVTEDGPWTMERACDFFDKKLRRLGHRFHLVYQNDPLADRDKDFTREMVDSALDPNVSMGVMPPGSIIVASMDPAPVGGAAIVIYALLPPDESGIRRRQVVDFEYGNNWRTDGTWQRIIAYSLQYHPKWWVFERSATTRYLLDDPQLEAIRKRYGFFIHEVGTGANKNYGDFAVSSLRELFIGKPTQLILPALNAADRERTKPLRDQLVDYHPDTSQPHDGPMALWFAERAIRDLHLHRQGVRVPMNAMKSWRDPYGGKWTGGSWSFKLPSTPQSGTIGPVKP